MHNLFCPIYNQYLYHRNTYQHRLCGVFSCVPCVFFPFPSALRVAIAPAIVGMFPSVGPRNNQVTSLGNKEKQLQCRSPKNRQDVFNSNNSKSNIEQQQQQQQQQLLLLLLLLLLTITTMKKNSSHNETNKSAIHNDNQIQAENVRTIHQTSTPTQFPS